ncbi:MAG: hypothetical protein DMF76_27380 [Acidobacteria bacterium]|nr:MAG: hypothetical protein DMF76_27380 [Acidobacteriota bacterium]
MAGQGVQLIPSPEEIMQILKRTGAFREGHFVYPNGKHTAHYFQMPLAFRYYDTVRRHSGRLRCARRAQRRADLLGRTGKRQADVPAIH